MKSSMLATAFLILAVIATLGISCRQLPRQESDRFGTIYQSGHHYAAFEVDEDLHRDSARLFVDIRNFGGSPSPVHFLHIIRDCSKDTSLIHVRDSNGVAVVLPVGRYCLSACLNRGSRARDCHTIEIDLGSRENIRLKFTLGYSGIH